MNVNRNNGHKNADAFFLMWYQCHEGPGRTAPCGHRERIWNSRDGVVPFGTQCSSCGGLMQHVDWDQDVYAPDHRPFQWQKIWAGMTPQRARYLADRMIRAMRAAGRSDGDVARLEAHYNNPDEPMLIAYPGD